MLTWWESTGWKKLDWVTVSCLENKTRICRSMKKQFKKIIICFILLTLLPQNRVAASFSISYSISRSRRKGWSSVQLTRKVLILKNKKLALECVTLLACLSFFPYFKNMESNPGLQKKPSGIILHFKRNEMFELTSHAILEIHSWFTMSSIIYVSLATWQLYLPSWAEDHCQPASPSTIPVCIWYLLSSQKLKWRLGKGSVATIKKKALF